jgi:hypothetical protein
LVEWYQWITDNPAEIRYFELVSTGQFSRISTYRLKILLEKSERKMKANKHAMDKSGLEWVLDRDWTRVKEMIDSMKEELRRRETEPIRY